MPHTILVTSPVIAPEARAILEAAGGRLHHTANYPDEATLCAAAAELRPVAILARQGLITAKVLDAAAPDLVIVARHGVGVDEVDVEAARERGLWVTRAPDSNTPQVAEHTVAMILALVKGLPAMDREVRAGRWRSVVTRGRDLAELGVGLVGFGAIARAVALLLAPFRVRLAAWDPYAPESLFGTVERLPTLPALLARSDVLSVHVPLVEATRNLIDAAAMALLPKDAVVVNTARGGIVDEAALAAALASGQLSGAGLDVFSPEPPPSDHPLLGQPRVLLTPHLAGVTPGSLRSMGTMAAECIAMVLGGGRPDPARVVTAPG